MIDIIKWRRHGHANAWFGDANSENGKYRIYNENGVVRMHINKNKTIPILYFDTEEEAMRTAELMYLCGANHD